VSGSTLLWSILTGMALVVPVSGLIQLLPLPMPNPASVAANAARIAHIPSWVLALKAVVLFPLLEECIYRGVILQLLRRYLPLWIALVPPTLIFGVTHLGFSPQNALFALLVGLYFAWLAIRGRSLLPSILCHAGINCFVVFLLPRLAGANDGGEPMSFLQPVPLALLLVSVTVLAIGVRQLRGEFGRATPAVVTA